MNKRNFIKTGVLAPLGALLPANLLAFNQKAAQYVSRRDKLVLSLIEEPHSSISFNYVHIERGDRWNWDASLESMGDKEFVVHIFHDEGGKRTIKESSVEEIEAILNKKNKKTK